MPDWESVNPVSTRCQGRCPTSKLEGSGKRDRIQNWAKSRRFIFKGLGRVIERHLI